MATMTCRQSEKLFPELHPPLTAAQAAIEARRCLECGGPYAPAPCTVACPTHINIPQFIRQIRLGDPQGSANTIFQANILGASCARICPVEALCQGACVLNKEGRRAVTIGLLQRYATDWLLKDGLDDLQLTLSEPQTLSVGVVGAGPAGLSCAAELAKLGYDVTVYEGRSDFGGLVTHAIAPYKQWREPLPKEVELIKKLGVNFWMGSAVGTDMTLEELEEKHAAIFLGIGLGQDIRLDIPGADLPGVWRSLDLVERLKGERLKGERLNEIRLGQTVAVIGGGNTAIDVAREAIRLGAKDVLMLYRRTEKEMPAYAHEVRQARAEGVRFWWLTMPVRFIGDDQLTQIECLKMRLGEPDISGRPRAEPVPGTEFTLDVDTAIIAIGQEPRFAFLKGIEDLELTKGLVKVNEQHQTTNQKYFAGGDCINGGATAVEAVQHGKLAAQGIHAYLAAQTSIATRKQKVRR
jgi:glutamate synthase (NADPH/NADH) small chain